MIEVSEFLDTVARTVDSTLDDVVPRPDDEPRMLHEAMRWSLFAGGKRIRPALVFAVGQTFGASIENLSATAAAIEMIHTYSLIHDDLPAMDDDDMRRGKATCHTRFGEATAILAGDALQTLAYKAVADDEKLPTKIRIKLISMITAAAGTPSGMVAGQQLDLAAEGRRLRISEIEQIHAGKTGALISGAACAGAMIGGASTDELVSIRTYASKLGLLFQITDDILDITQASETLGKTAGKDAAVAKATYPGHLGITKTRIIADNLRREACDELLSIQHETTLLKSLIEIIVNRTR